MGMDSMKKKILERLDTEFYITATQLASEVGASEKTVRTRIKELNEELKEHGAQIHSRRNAGFCLRIDDVDAYEAWRKQSMAITEALPATSAERVQYLLAYLLNHSDYIKLDDLSQFLYISRNSLTADLKQVEHMLKLYDLSIDRRPSYGIRIEGSEFNRRICIANCLLKRERMGMDLDKQKQDMKRLADILKDVLQECKLNLSETAFESLVLHLYVANGRIQRNCPVDFSPEAKEEACKNLRDYAMEAAVKIAQKVEQVMGIRYSDQELFYLAIHVDGKTFPDSSKHKPNLVITERIDKLVLQMLTAVYEGNGIDFRDNLELRMSLNQHMVPFDIRMKYGIPMHNPLLDEIKKEYAFAYAIAATACTVLRQYYNKKIPEDETGYFALLFALANEKKDRQLGRKNIVVVCISGRGSSQLFLYKYRQAFGKYINQIYECTVFDLETFDFKGKEIAYVFTTVPLSCELPAPVFEVSQFLSSEEVENYRRLFERGDMDFLRRYYDERLFMGRLQGETKEEVLEKMCAHIRTVRELPNGFLKSVLLRERMGQTDFGNLVAIAHPHRIMTKEPFVAAAVLEKPIWWGHNQVQVVFLAAMSEKKAEEDIERFYQATTDFVFNADAVQQLIASPDYATLLRLLGYEKTAGQNLPERYR